MSIKDELLNTIETYVQKAINKQSPTRVIPSVVTGVENGKYKVNIDGNNYMIKDAVGINPTAGMGVWVMIPDMGIGQAFIVGKR